MLPALAALCLAAPFPPLPVDLDAASARYDEKTGQYTLSGGVTVKRAGVVVRAARAIYDPRRGEVSASGGVLVVEPARVLAAQGAVVDLAGPFDAHDVVIFLKPAGAPLGAVTTLDEARAAGKNLATLNAAHLVQDRPGHLVVEKAGFTLCDCGGGAPSWKIAAHAADVEQGKRAILTWPVLYLTPRFIGVSTPVPVLALPALYVPLGDRQSGLLLPELNYTARNGFEFSEPLFLTLGRSWDATVAAGYTFGTGLSKTSLNGVEGPGANLELRATPVEGTKAVLRVHWLHDLQHENLGYFNGAAHVSSIPRGDRYALSFAQDSVLSPRTRLKADVALVGDPDWTRDFTGDVLLRNVDYRRSSFLLGHRLDSVVVELDASYLLPLRNLGTYFLSPSDRAGPLAAWLKPAPFGVAGSSLPAFHRLPALTATLLPTRIAGPLALSGEAGFARFAPISGVTGDEGASGLGYGDRGGPFGVGNSLLSSGLLDGRWEPGERLAGDRASVRAELAAPFVLGDALLAEPRLAGFGAGYAFENGAALAGARGTASLTLSSELARSWGEGKDRVRHAVRPFLEWRAGSRELGPALPSGYAYDELDSARFTLPASSFPAVLNPWRALSATVPGGFDQLRVGIGNRVTGLGRSLLDVDVGQDFDLLYRRVGEAFVSGGFSVGPASGSVLARYDSWNPGPCLLYPLDYEGTLPGTSPPQPNPRYDPAKCVNARPAPRRGLDAFTQLRADLRLADHRGDDLHGSYNAVGPGGSAQLMAGLDPLFDLTPLDTYPAALATAGLRVKAIPGLTLVYDVLANPRTQPGGTCSNPSALSSPPRIMQHSAGFAWDSPCKCWKLAITVAKRECEDVPSFFWTFDLSQLTQGRAF